MAFAVVRVRSPRDKQKRIEDTLNMLRLNKVNHCTVIPENPKYEGMLTKAKDMITWGEIDKDTLIKLLKYRPDLDEDQMINKIEDHTDFEDLEAFAEAVVSDKITLDEIDGLKNLFRMHPPIKGYDNVKKPYKTGGCLGYRSDEINSLLRNMLGPEYGDSDSEED